jgi:hypothetical protein
MILFVVKEFEILEQKNCWKEQEQWNNRLFPA